MTPYLVGVLLVVTVLDWVAVVRGWRRVEFVAKPLTLVILASILVLNGNFQSLPLVCFAIGLFFSLVGDIFMLISYKRFSDNWFMAGLLAFLLGHLGYIFGLNLPGGEISIIWAFALAVILALTSARILRIILAGVRAKKLQKMALPVLVYGMVITVMLLSAMLTPMRSFWKTGAALLVSLGAILFYASDVILAWNKFVSPIRNGRLLNMVSYHLGQMALIAGALLQFSA